MTTQTKGSEDFNRFTDFMRKLVSVPHDEIKARLEAEKAAKKTEKATPIKSPR